RSATALGRCAPEHLFHEVGFHLKFNGLGGPPTRRCGGGLCAGREWTERVGRAGKKVCEYFARGRGSELAVDPLAIDLDPTAAAPISWLGSPAACVTRARDVRACGPRLKVEPHPWLQPIQAIDNLHCSVRTADGTLRSVASSRC